MPKRLLTAAFLVTLIMLGGARTAVAQASPSGGHGLDRPAPPEVGLATLDLPELRRRRTRLGPEMLGAAWLTGLGAATLLGGAGMLFGSFECVPTMDPGGPACRNDPDLLAGGFAAGALGLALLIPAAIWLAAVDGERRRLDEERERRVQLGLSLSRTEGRIRLAVPF